MTLQEKLLNYYPNFLTKLPESNQYKFIKTLRNSLITLQTTLKILEIQEDIERPILIWKVQKTPGIYSMHFQIHLEAIRKVEIYKDDNLIKTFSYKEEEARNEFYHVISNIYTDSDEIIPSSKYYIHVVTYSEDEFYKGYPENDDIVSDFLKIEKFENNDGTYKLNFKSLGLKNIYEVKIETYADDKLLNTYIENKENFWNEEYLENSPEFINNVNINFNKVLENDIVENKYKFIVKTCEGKDSLTNHYINQKTYSVVLDSNFISDDIYNHDYSLDIIGKRLNFPRSKFNIYSSDNNINNLSEEYLDFYLNTEPQFNNSLTEDDYHYQQRLKFYISNLQSRIDDNTIGWEVLSFIPHRKNTNIIAPLELVQLEVFKEWGVVPELINRDKYLFKQNNDLMRGLLCGPGDEGVKLESEVKLIKIEDLIVGVKSKLKGVVSLKNTGELIGRGNIVFRIKYENSNTVEVKKVKILNYQAILNFTPTEVGNITVELIYQGTGKYKRAKFKKNLYVNLVPVKIYAPNLRTHLNNPYTLSAHLISTRNSTEEIKGKIKFIIEGTSIEKILEVNTTNGELKLDYINEVKYLELVNNLDIGTYNVIVEYTGEDVLNNQFQNAKSEFKLKVSLEEEHLFIHSIFTPPNHISAKVYNEDYTPLSKSLRLKYKGVTIDTIETSPNKYIPFSNLAYIPENLGDLELVFDGDDDYYPNTYQVPPLEDLSLENTKILINSNYKAIKGENLILTAILLSNQGTLLTNKKLSLYEKGELIGEYLTDNNGVCIINYLKEELGEYSLNLEFSGEDLRYYPTNAQTVIKVSDKLNTKIEVDKTTVYVDGTLNISLYDENGFKIPYGKIKLINNTKTDINYNTVFKEVKTDINGIATVEFNMTPKTNKQIKIQFDQTKEYNSSSLEINDFNVIKHPLNMSTTPTANTNIPYTDNGFKIQTRLLDGETLKPVEGLNVSWEFRRESTKEVETVGSVKTNSDGIAEYQIHYAPGEYTYGVIVPASPKYNLKDTRDENYRIPINIVTEEIGKESLKTFEIEVLEDEILAGDEYTVNGKLIGNRNITPKGSVQIYTGKYENGILTGKQSNPLVIEDIGGGIGKISGKLLSNVNMNTPQEFTIKGFYTGDENFKKDTSENYTKGYDILKVVGKGEKIKENIKDFKLEIKEKSIYPYETYHIKATLEAETSPTGIVSFYIHGDKTGKQGEGNLTPLENGKSELNLELKANTTNTGTYTLYGYYTGDENYNTSDSINYPEGVKTIDLISKTNTQTESNEKTTPTLILDATPNPVEKGEDYTIIGKLPSNATGTISIMQNAKLIETVNIGNGIGTLKLNTSQYNPNNGKFTVKYNGDRNYNSKIEEIQVIMKETIKKTKFTLLSNKMYKNEKFKVKLEDTNGNPIAGYRFTITLTQKDVGSKTYTTEQPTDYQGIGYIKPTMDRENGTELEIDLNFTGAGNYSSTSMHDTIKYYMG